MRFSTAQQLADYFAKEVMMGRGQWRVQVDPRDIMVGNVVPPPAGKTFDEATKTLYVAIRIEGVHSEKQ